MALANTIMEGQLPMNSFTDEIERHRVQNQFAGSVFPQQTEVMQQDSNRPFAIDQIIGLQPAKRLLDGFIDLGKQSFERQLQHEITKIERMQMTSTEFKNFLEHDFVFSNVSPAIDILSTMLGQESVSPPTPDEEAVISARIRNLDPSLLTDQRAQIKILKSPTLWVVLYEVYQKYAAKIEGYAQATWKYVQMLVQMLRKTAKDYNLPIPPWFDNPPPPPGGGGGGGQPPPAPPAPPADPTAPPSVQRPDTADTADPTLETESAPQTGTAMPESTVMPPTPPTAPTPVVMPPTTPTTGGGLRYHGRNPVGYPPPPTNMPPSTHSPLADDMVLPQYTPFYMAVIQYMLLTGAAGYAVFRNIRRPVDVPPGGVLVDNAVEGGAQQRVASLFHFLVINFTEQLFSSNLAHYLIENLRQGDPFFMNTRFGEWTRMLVQQAVANTLVGQPLFPDQTEIPISRLSPRQAAEALLRYYEGLTNPDNAVVEAIRRYLARQPQEQGVVQIMEREVPINILDKADYDQSQYTNRVTINNLITGTVSGIKDYVATNVSYSQISLARGLRLVKEIALYMVNPYGRNMPSPTRREEDRRGWADQFAELARKIATQGLRDPTLNAQARSCLADLSDLIGDRAEAIQNWDDPSPFLMPFLQKMVEYLELLITSTNREP